MSLLHCEVSLAESSSEKTRSWPVALQARMYSRVSWSAGDQSADRPRADGAEGGAATAALASLSAVSAVSPSRPFSAEGKEGKPHGRALFDSGSGSAEPGQDLTGQDLGTQRTQSLADLLGEVALGQTWSSSQVVNLDDECSFTIIACEAGGGVKLEEQRLEAEVGIIHSQGAYGFVKGLIGSGWRALAGSGRCLGSGRGGGGSKAALRLQHQQRRSALQPEQRHLGVQRNQRLADLPTEHLRHDVGARSKLEEEERCIIGGGEAGGGDKLLEQRLEAEAGVSHSQRTHVVEEHGLSKGTHVVGTGCTKLSSGGYYAIAGSSRCVGNGRGGGGSLGDLVLSFQRQQRLAHRLGDRSQVWLLLPQLGEQRSEAEVGFSHSQGTHGVE
eukprot:scaffold19060_cov62-Phaeocystis_antarctica.AAC.9